MGVTLIRVAAQVGGVENLPGGIELRDVGVRAKTVERAAGGARPLQGKIGAIADSSDVGGALVVNGEGPTCGFAGMAAQVSRVGQDGVEHQRASVVVGANLEGALAGTLEHVLAGHFLAGSG